MSTAASAKAAAASAAHELLNPACPNRQAAFEALAQCSAALDAEADELKMEAQRCRAAGVCARLSAAFDTYPKVKSFSLAPRGMGMGLAINFHTGPCLEEHNIDFDKRMTSRTAPWHHFESLIDELLKKSSSIHWNISFDDWHGESVSKGSPLEIAASLGMDWMLPWTEAAAIGDASSTPAPRCKTPALSL